MYIVDKIFIFFLPIILSVNIAYANENIAEKYGCKNLHEIQSGEDVLRQLYDNLNTDCFLNIPDVELEKIWGIKVIDYDDPNQIAKTMNQETFSKWLKSKPIIKGKMSDKIEAGFRWTEQGQRSYLILSSLNSSFNLLDYNDHFPYNLPYPVLRCDYNHYSAHSLLNLIPYDKVNYGIYIPQCRYLWEKKIKGKMNRLEVVVSYPLEGGILGSYHGRYKSFTFFINID